MVKVRNRLALILLFSVVALIFNVSYAKAAPIDNLEWKIIKKFDYASTFNRGDIIYRNGIYIATTRPAMYYSTDLVTWTSIPVPVAYSDGYLSYVNNKFFVMGGPRVGISSDGINWDWGWIYNGNTNSGVGMSSIGTNIYWTGSKYVAAGGTTVSGMGRTAIATSPDGLNWNMTKVFGAYPDSTAGDMLYNGTLFIMPRDPDGGGVYTSTDGNTWNLTDTGMSYNGMNVQMFGKWVSFCKFKGNSTFNMCTSSDAVNWQQMTTPPNTKYIYSRDLFSADGVYYSYGSYTYQYSEVVSLTDWRLKPGFDFSTFSGSIGNVGSAAMQKLTHDGRRFIGILVTSDGAYIFTGEPPNTPPTVNVSGTLSNVYLSRLDSYNIKVTWGSKDIDGNNLIHNIYWNGALVNSFNDWNTSTGDRSNTIYVNSGLYPTNTQATANTLTISVNDGRASDTNSVYIYINYLIPIKAIQSKPWDSDKINHAVITDMFELANNVQTVGALNELKSVLDTNNIILTYITVASNKSLLESVLGARVKVVVS